MKKHILLALCLCLQLHATANWQRSITNYSRQTYKAANQNWMVAQHDNGWMYFANNKGLLEYDGVTWNTYSIHNAKTRAVKQGRDGRIYVGGLGQFGYFTPNPTGGLDYTCLSDSLKAGVFAGNIWNIHIVDERVYFQSDASIFYLEEGRALKQISCGRDIMHSAVINNKFYMTTDQGLCFLNGDSFSVIPNTRECVQSKTVGILPFEGKVLIVSSLNGIFQYDGSQISVYESSAGAFLRANQLFCSAMKDSLLALGSVQDGVALLNTANGQIEKISTGNGLQNKTVLSMQFDRENNLWLGLDNGIDCLHLNAPMLFLYSKKSAIGSGYASCFYNGKLYLGTNQGLYVSNSPISPEGEVKLDLIAGSEGQVWSIEEYDNKLFCGGGNFLLVIDGGRILRMKGIRGVWSIVRIAHQPDFLIAGTYSGLYLLSKTEGEWEVAQRIEGAAYSAKTMYLEEMSNALWIANKAKGLYRYVLSEDLKSVTVKNYNDESLPAGNNFQVTKINDEIVVASRQGLFRYNQIKDRLERHTELEALLDGNAAYTYISEDEQGDIWYVTDGMLKLARYNAQTKAYQRNESESYLKGFLIEDFEHIHVYSKEYALIGTEEGFCLLQFGKQQPRKHPLNLQIRKVYLTPGKDSLIYGRSYEYDGDRATVIPYQYNSLRIEYSVNNYDKSLVSLYAYRLEGDDHNGWSEYSENNTKEYTNLKEGKYIFHVKLITNNDKDPVATSFTFRILPPWYRSWWIYTLYVFTGIGILFYLYTRLTRFRKESKLKDQKIVSLKEKNLQSELKHKSDELIRTTLNIVRKNEMLQAIRKDVLSISNSASEENLASIKRKTLRLISQIDTNMEHDDDLQTFQRTFDSVHEGFFEKLGEKFPGLNSKEKLLCAYIRMDLMSKEIAPLMNVSVRGVEIGRYRLRKKLMLSQEENLAEFLRRV